jgi:hypothetical protein
MIVDPKTLKDNRFALDFAFDSSVSDITSINKLFASQTRIYQLCGEDVITQTLDGYNVCVLAYGQTGSGKVIILKFSIFKIFFTCLLELHHVWYC